MFKFASVSLTFHTVDYVYTSSPQTKESTPGLLLIGQTIPGPKNIKTGSQVSLSKGGVFRAWNSLGYKDNTLSKF